MKRKAADYNESDNSAVDTSGKENGIKKTPNTSPKNVELKPNPQLPTLLVNHRSSRNIKPNSLIFTKDVEVNMPRKKNIAKKNVLINNAIKTINKKSSKLVGNTVNKFKFKSTGYNLKKNLNNRTATKLTAPKLTTRRKCTKQDQVTDDQSSLTTSSTDELEDSVSNENENKNSINLNASKLTHLFNKQQLTKNGKVKGRPRKPIVIDNILDCLKEDETIANSCDSKDFKNLLEKIDESHKNQIVQLKKELDDKDKEKVMLDVKYAALMKEIQSIKELHSQEISEIKKKLWCSNSGCGKQAIYFCCFNAFYCSLNCQSEHWYSIHKESCKNKNRSEHKTHKKINMVKHHNKVLVLYERKAEWMKKIESNTLLEDIEKGNARMTWILNIRNGRSETF